MPTKRHGVNPEQAAGLIKQTAPRPDQAPPPEQPEDPVKAIGVGLKKSEWERIAEIAKTLSMKKHELAVWALRDFLKRYDAGEIPTQTRPSLPER